MKEDKKRAEELRRMREVLVKVKEFYDLMDRVRG